MKFYLILSLSAISGSDEHFNTNSPIFSQSVLK